MKRIIKEINVVETETANQITVEIFYDKGGMNYLSGNTTQRGIHLTVRPELVKKDPNSKFVSRQFTIFKGYRKFLLPMGRFNQKKFDEYVPDQTLIEEIVDRVVREQNLTKI